MCIRDRLMAQTLMVTWLTLMSWWNVTAQTKHRNNMTANIADWEVLTMPNMCMTKLPMPEQDPKVRARNFEEVSYGYTEEMAIEEAQRCLNCKHMPCVSGCPVNVQIPKFISLIAQGKFADACSAIKETSALPAVCGRVCPQETQCEAKCVRGIKGCLLYTSRCV